ncbi:MAG TPA: thioredoxin [Rhodospirillaceae bacterium]|nr:thiol reductase thioredoxin [Rhodospirillaceae bacterium]HAA93728.1 thioredoxin [Rhodospirillaceae bacterium]HAT34308.1 thioredoxin [Rhodospirillaceae bacterium]
MTFQDGLHLVVKKDCPTCILIEPAVRSLAAESELSIYVQDDPNFLADLKGHLDDSSLQNSFHLDIETVPTLLAFQNGKETGRAVGWHKGEWQTLTGLEGLGEDLPDLRPGCGSKSVEPGVAEHLKVRFGETGIKSRSITPVAYEDEHELCYDRGWSDGLPVIPPTPERILRMLEGTSRDPQEIIGKIPPNLVDCTVEKVAINAVMAGCKPEYLPLVIACIETALEPHFTLHGILCSTCFSSPVIVVNGPVAKRIGMNSGINALGNDNRANVTIGRAVNLVVRNVGGGVPGGIDRATLGGPGKISFCFAEDESDEAWTPLSVARGCTPGTDAVTVFQGDGIQGFIDMRSRTPEELTGSLAASLAVVGNIKQAEYCNAMLVLAPEHYEIYRQARWGRDEIENALFDALRRPGKDLVRGAGGIGEGIDPARADEMVDKFWRDHGLLIVRAGGQAGLFSAILAGWPGGRAREDSKPITKEVSL